MTCPTAYINQHIDVQETFNSSLFFKNYVVNEWDFRHYLAWKHISTPITSKSLNALLKEYKDVVSAFQKKKTLPDELLGYLGKLKLKDTPRETTTYLSQTFTNSHFTDNVIGVLSGTLHTTSTGEKQRRPLDHAPSSSTQSFAKTSSPPPPPPQEQHQPQQQHEQQPQQQQPQQPQQPSPCSSPSSLSSEKQQQQQQKRPQSILQIGQEELVTKNDNNGNLHANKKIRLYVSKAGACLDTSGSDNDGSYIDTSNSDDDELNLTHGKLDYLVGPGELTVNTEVMSDPLFSSWILNDTNVSSIFLSYRNRVVNKAKQYQHLTMMDTLALNFIFLINIDKPTPAFLSRNEWNNITLAMMTTNPIARFQHQQGQWYNNSRNVQER
ncbi:unnamed protein product [Absidia cylindrospora]